jgi:hypothetical protein
MFASGKDAFGALNSDEARLIRLFYSSRYLSPGYGHWDHGNHGERQNKAMDDQLGVNNTQREKRL